ncbi:KpsF/GutQ family sugar-phosphate isomerase [Flaviaesturariibacter amylovorans]|uniref:KpsF/GutQ family sugar-phosphate isomerase n=1 Tax=Flaviaesturariibacter amylovorans TaxID=1084520 RepID=UPI0031E6BA89
MKPDTSILEAARRTLLMEAESVRALTDQLDGFEATIETLAACTGRIVISGIGKSAIIAQKIVATLNSTGTPALFLHAADAIHGDLGMVQPNDAVMIISKSGESPEIRVLVPFIKNFGNCVIGMVGNTESFLARHSDFILNTTVQQEACPNNLAPTTSTTAQLAMGDAIAVCLMEHRGFKVEDFAKLHPGGALGKKLFLRVGDLSRQNEQPQVNIGATLKEVIVEITKRRLGMTAVINNAGELSGVITDGDLRRMLERTTSLEGIQAGHIMTESPKTIDVSEMAVSALDIMRSNNITQLLVLDGGAYAGVIHLHDLIREGLL